MSEESDEPNSRYQPKTHFWAQFGSNLGLNGPTRAPKNFEPTKNSQQLNIVEIN